MKKAQASLVSSKLKHEIITFPGYAGILFGWAGVVSFAILLVISLFMNVSTSNQAIVENVTQSNVRDTNIFAYVLGVVVIIIMIAALWVYVASWTKKALEKLAQILRIPQTNYWSFCTVLLVVGWLILCVIIFVVSDDKYLGQILFLSAAVITLGSSSFGVAALLQVPVQSQSNEIFSVKFSATQSVNITKISKQSYKKDLALKKKSDPNF